MKDERQDTLFAKTDEDPLAQSQRPKKLEDIVGQTHFLNDRFRKVLSTDRWTGMIFWGPPGSGKTSLASVIAKTTQRPFEMRSAVTSGVKELREILDRSRAETRSGRPAWILFVDEVHRLNKAQQDVLLPYLEEGSIRFIGATTENPSFEINNAICSRCLIFHFQPLTEKELLDVLNRAAARFPNVAPEAIERIARMALGDARRALTLLEHLLLSAPPGTAVGLKELDELMHSQSLYYDKKSELHYDTISAFIKSVRGSDPDAALYYLARMLEGGEDPLFIARRLIILASEDIGNAQPLALVLATSAFQAVHAIGMPEARIVLGQATTYLACCEKSNRSYRGIESAIETVRRTGQLQVPMPIRNAPTSQMKDWGYGKGYQYAHDFEKGWARMDFLPEEIKKERFYEPSPYGAEKRFQEFLKERKGLDRAPGES